MHGSEVVVIGGVLEIRAEAVQAALAQYSNKDAKPRPTVLQPLKRPSQLRPAADKPRYTLSGMSPHSFYNCSVHLLQM